MNKNKSSIQQKKARKAQGENIPNLSQGITERLLRKYRPSKVISLIEGNHLDVKNDIAA
tara:strand:- start:752 stop:928 length:177 start_codon:yes stop_codon:yes gene_type:complete